MNLYIIRDKLNKGELLSNINLRVTFYCRVSTDHEEQLNSLDNQIDFFREYIKSNSNWEYIEGYIDEGISGTSDIKRVSFMDMISDASKDKFDLILTKEISRFSRNTLDSIKYTRYLLDKGVCVYFLNDNINTINADSELRLTIMATLAQDEIRKLSSRVKFGMERAIKNGHILGNKQLYGYLNYRINKEEALIIKSIYNMYVIDNYSLTKITNILNKKGILSPNKKSWCVSTIKRLIENPKYKGYYCGKKTSVVDYINKKVKYLDKSEWIVFKDKNIPRIVSVSIWNRANEKINKTRKHISYKDNKYSMKIYCAVDNSPYYKRKLRTNAYSWYCSNYLKNGKSSCNNIIIKEQDLNRIIMDIINCSGFDYHKVLYLLNNNDINADMIYEETIKSMVNKIMVDKYNLTIFLNIDINIIKDYYPYHVITLCCNNIK